MDDRTSSDSLTSVSTWYRNTILPGLEGGITKLFNAAAYGATGDGETDDTAALQSVIDAAEAVTTLEGGGVVWLPPGKYIITDQLTIQKSIGIVGTGVMGWETGASLTDPTTVIEWKSGTSGSGKSCIYIYSGSTSRVLDGVKIVGIQVDANGEADYAVQALGVRNSEFDLMVVGATSACFSLESILVATWRNRVRLTGGVLSGSAHLLIVQKAGGAYAGSTRENEIVVHGYHDDGDLVRIVDGDSNLITAVSYQQSGGTGYALTFTASVLQAAVRNVAKYVRGSINFGSSVNIGNVVEIQDPTTTGGTTGSISSSAIFRLTTLSGTNGGLWKTHGFKWLDELEFPASRLTAPSSGAATLDVDGFWSFGPSADESAYFVFRSPYEWAAGTITSIKLSYSMSTSAAGDVALEVATAALAGTHGAGAAPTLTARYDAAQTVYATANTFLDLTLTPSVSWAIASDTTYYVNVKRKGSAGGDTHGGNFQLWDLRIEYTATGPTGSDATSARTS